MFATNATSKALSLALNDSYPSFQSPYSNTETIFIVLVMAVIFFMGLAGNTLTITVISRVPSMHTPTNLLVLNLSVADIFVAIFFVLFTTIDIYISQEWIFGAFLCKVIPFLQLTAVRVSILSLALISVERYLTVCKPKNRRLSVGKIKFFIALLWLIGMAFASPVLVVKEVSETSGKRYCAETGWAFHTAKLYTTIIFVIMYLIPIFTMSFAYTNIGLTVWKSEKATKTKRMAHSIIPKQKTTKLCLALVISFVISWAPVHAVALDLCWGTLMHSLPQNVTFLLFPLFTGIAFSNCALNPVLYSLMSQNFRSAFEEAFRKVRLNPNYTRRTLRRRLSTEGSQCNFPLGNTKSMPPLSELSIKSFESSV